MIERDMVTFAAVGRLPHEEDNCAIAIRTLEAGMEILIEREGGEGNIVLTHTVLEGHRFAVRPLAKGEALLSWSLPFGIAQRDIAAGEYVCNQEMLDELQMRRLPFELPQQPNFTDLIRATTLDRERFKAAEPVPHYNEQRYFMGYPRPHGRGVGTRNTIILLGTTARTAAFVRLLEKELKGLSAHYPQVDGIVAIAHTEGDGPQINNRELLLRTLAGWIVHPNVAAALIVDYGVETVNNAVLRNFMEGAGYLLNGVPHQFLSLQDGFQAALLQAQEIVKAWLPEANAAVRQQTPLSELKIALQCGGSDAFSGISGNPLAGWVAGEVIRYGGSANLAETDELMGAEPYILRNIRDWATAEKFLNTIQRFKSWAKRHGVSPEANPSGGNRLRGLYNIALKAIGAANKKDPSIRLDYVIDYGEMMTEPGFYFMDSPGNDLESIAGQVACGCNMIFFITGNGSITNFPFVPTLKFVTTSRRFELLRNDMDINAGRYLDGEPLVDIGRETLELAINVASGQRSVGEKAGHAQVQIWRNWSLQEGDERPLVLLENQELSGKPVILNEDALLGAVKFPAVDVFATAQGVAAEQIGLILPTSLCAGQIAQIAVNQLNETGLAERLGLSRFETLVHTEGCGFARTSLALYTQTLLGYLSHPLVSLAMLLEHGCEKTHNDYFRRALAQAGKREEQFGWASIQLAGGIERVLAQIEGWFEAQAAENSYPVREPLVLPDLTIGFMLTGEPTPRAAEALALLMQSVLGGGGRVIVSEHFNPLTHPVLSALLEDGEAAARPTIGYGQRPEQGGLHVMSSANSNWSEVLTGVGATGAAVVVAYVAERPGPGHPLVPVLQISDDDETGGRFAAELDGGTELFEDEEALLRLVGRVLAGEVVPQSRLNQNLNFQISRGLLGIST